MWGLLQAVVKKTEKDFVLLVGKGYGYLPKLQSYAKHGYVDMLEYWLFKRTDLARTSGDYEKKTLALNTTGRWSVGTIRNSAYPQRATLRTADKFPVIELLAY